MHRVIRQQLAGERVSYMIAKAEGWRMACGAWRLSPAQGWVRLPGKVTGEAKPAGGNQ